MMNYEMQYKHRKCRYVRYETFATEILEFPDYDTFHKIINHVIHSIIMKSFYKRIDDENQLFVLLEFPVRNDLKKVEFKSRSKFE